MSLRESIFDFWESILGLHELILVFEVWFWAFGNNFRYLGVKFGIWESILRVILSIYDSSLDLLDRCFATVSRFWISGSQFKNLGVKIRQPGLQDGGLKVTGYKWYDIIIFCLNFCMEATGIRFWLLGFDFWSMLFDFRIRE